MRDFVTSAGARMFYQDNGHGRSLLFLHGWLMSQSVWMYQAPLADSFRVVTPDLRGHGNSTGAEFSYSGCVADLVELLNHLGMEKTIVVGWSMGAQIALQAWPLLRDRLAALVLVGGTPHFCAGDGYEHGVPYAEARGMALRLRSSFIRTADGFYRGMFSIEDQRGTDINAMAKSIVSRLPQLPVALAALDELVNADLRALLADIAVPVLLVHGESDRICLPGAARYMHAQLPDSRLQLFPGVGHAPFIVRQAEFNAQLTSFARGVYEAD